MDRSVLELRVGGLPFPHGGPDGEWRYRHAVRPDGVTPLDRQAVADFLAYETWHGRPVDVVADPDLSGCSAWRAPEVRPDPGSFPVQCCTHVYPGGCGEPADYFEHVMRANGRCTAPEAVAYSRVLGRDLTPADLTPGYPPAVRFYFRWRSLADHPGARFDGVHPVKILGGLRLDEGLVAVVAPASQHGPITVSAGRFQDRIAFVDIERPSPQDWAVAAFTAAQRLA
jgi:hypothetical protein